MKPYKGNTEPSPLYFLQGPHLWGDERRIAKMRTNLFVRVMQIRQVSPEGVETILYGVAL